MECNGSQEDLTSIEDLVSQLVKGDEGVKIKWGPEAQLGQERLGKK